jgi:hypothetical protein
MMRAPTAATAVRAPRATDRSCRNFKQRPTASQGTAPVDRLLHRLDRVHQRDRGQWSARCPAHEDRGPSLTIKELDDGKVLLHCFSGCSVENIVGAIGLTLADLFPRTGPTPGAGTSPLRLRLPAYQALEILAFESTVIGVIGTDLVAGRQITEADRERLVQAVARVLRISEATR